MALSNVNINSLNKIFERIPQDRRVRKMIQNKMYAKMRSFLDNPIGTGAVSLGVSISIILSTTPGVALSALIGLLVGMSTTFITMSVAKRLKKMEDDVSCTSVERNLAVEDTLALLEKVQSYSINEDFSKVLTDVMGHLKDSTTSYALWRDVNECLRAIDRDREKSAAVNIQQAKINTAVEQLSNKMKSSHDRVFKL